jgi:rubredoxin
MTAQCHVCGWVGDLNQCLKVTAFEPDLNRYGELVQAPDMPCCPQCAKARDLNPVDLKTLQ